MAASHNGMDTSKERLLDSEENSRDFDEPVWVKSGGKAWRTAFFGSVGIAAVLLVLLVTSRAHRSVAARLPTDVETTHHSIYLVTGGNGATVARHAMLQTPATDLMILCYAERCEEQWPHEIHDPEGLQFVFYPKSTWTEARNRMLALVKEREARTGRSYLYYTFLDEDMVATIDNGTQAGYNYHQRPDVDAGSPRAPWSLYEEMLSEYLPAIGTPRCCSWVPKPFGAEDVMTVSFFDGMMTSIHRLAAPILLPYGTNFDSQNWWASEVMLMLRSTCTWGSVMQFNTILGPQEYKAETQEHANYPKGGNDWDLARSALDLFMPKELHRLTTRVGFTEKGWISPIALPRADWLSTVPPSCHEVTTRGLENKGFDLDLA